MGSTYIQRSNGRIFINKKRGNSYTPYTYHTSMKIGTVDKNYGETTPIYAPKDDRLDEFVEVASIRGTESRWGSSFTGRIPTKYKSILRELSDNRCAFDAQIHYGLCTNPASFHNYESILILENALISQYTTTELTALTPDERGVLEETINITAENVYPVYQTELYENADEVTSLGAIVALTKGNYATCEDCLIPCASYFGIRIPQNCNLAGNNLTIIYTLDNGETWEETVLNCNASVCDNDIETYNIESDGTYLYLTFNEGSSTNGHLYIVPISEVIEGTITSYIYNELLDSLTIYDTALTEKSLWIVGTNGIIYKLDRALMTYSLQSNTTLFTNTWYDVSAYDDNNILVAGATGRLLVRTNGSSFRLITLTIDGDPVTDNLYNVLMKSKTEWLVATSTGELYCTMNSGKSWKLIYDFNSCITNIVFSSNNVGYLATKQPARVYRTIDGGFSWQELPDSYDIILDTAAFLGVDSCEPNSFYAYGIESATIPDPCENTSFSEDQVGIIVTGARY